VEGTSVTGQVNVETDNKENDYFVEKSSHMIRKLGQSAKAGCYFHTQIIIVETQD